MATINEIAEELKTSKQPITLIYAFNSTGKTKLSVEYKNLTKKKDGKHSGVYYNAYSEDLFRWDNDELNGNENMRLEILKSSLNPYFSSIIENPDLFEEKLSPYLPKYTYEFDINKDSEIGIDAIRFSRDEESNIKISRGEERIFVWCFFLALFEVDAWAGNQDAHFFIDDPVSSLDEHNIFLTAESIFDLIEEHYLKKRIIITTHHIGLFSILFDKLKKGEKSGRFNKLTKPFILNTQDGNLLLNSLNNDVFLFHLHLIQTLDTAIKTELYAYHFVLLRQLLENISSFLGVGRVGYTLEQIGIEKVEEVGNIINSLSHKNAYRMQFNKMAEADEDVFKDVFGKLQAKYRFIY